ncbi:uncharacterized protein LOC135835171 [Planococcus citri]|uniref:uncharacterized protein LOC135835171 n=1 Tax=Planococcus citri TaxID=170843 RepID=UPI0031F7718E
MDQILFSIVTLLLIYNSQSAPQFPAYPDFPYYRAHSAPHYPSQSNYPGYFYYQHPFAYDPYSNPYYIYNHLGPVPQKFLDSKPTVDTKPSHSETESSAETRKINLKSSSSTPVSNLQQRTPIIPNIQYVPIYARNLDSWTAKEIPVTVILDENYEKSYNVPYNTYQNPYVRNYVEQPKPSSETASSSAASGPRPGPGSIILKSAAHDEGHTINVHEISQEQSQYIQGAPIIPNVASISTPQASIAFYPTPYQGPISYGAGRDLGSWNVNEIPISAVVVDEGVNDKNSEKEIKQTEEKIDSASPVISSIKTK